MSLAPCPGCQRHIRVGESACPFCGASVTAALASKVIPGATQRLSRAAAFVFTATLTVAGCGDDIGSAMPLYGAPVDAALGEDRAAPTDSGSAVDTGRPTDTGVVSDNGGPMPLDGAPADAGMTADVVRPPDDNGGPMPLYGGPVRPDAGPPEDLGGNVALYGAPVDRDAGAARDSGPPRDNGGVMALYGAVPADSGFEDDATTRDGSIGVRYGGPVRFDGG